MGVGAGNGLREVRGRARADRLTKNLVKRIRLGEIAVIAHEDIDAVAGETLVSKKPLAVLNAYDSASGKYLNGGPEALLQAGIPLVDLLGEPLMEKVKDGDEVSVVGERVLVNGAEFQGRVFSRDHLESAQVQARLNLEEGLQEFVNNTLSYISKEGHSLLERPSLPPLKTDIAGRHCVVVCRSGEHERDLRAILPYIRERRPVLIGVDGAVDGMLRQGLRPHIIFGDMDSISDQGLRCGAEIIVHAYSSGEAPGLKRVEELGLPAQVFRCPGTSEDAALLLAYHSGADLAVNVGSRWSLEEFLDRGRKGMASNYLTRLKIGARLVDARGVSRLHRRSVGFWHLAGLAFSGLLVVGVITAFSPFVRGYLELVGVEIRMGLRALANLLSFGR